ncbi:MAG: hypothetical protein Q8811_01795, partial [Candidatus Phytoplasma australasiaticum]|nr:hypothetical protein [Candidatus Phytoplasma australasiaticum]
KLKSAELKMNMSLERIDHLKRDLVDAKKELEKSFKQKVSSMMFDSLTPQRQNNRKGLGYVKKNSHNKHVTISNDLLCIYCGRDGHLKLDCPA